MELLREITEAEDLYRNKLESFFNAVYRKSNLDSHGLDHHRRVWGYSRQLITSPETAGLVTGKYFPLKLLIASYLHDSGMSVDPGPRHGHLGRIFCEQFLADNGLVVNDFADVLEAIEYHDKKDYQDEKHDSGLLNILTVADDIDALGYTGIYRYLEIYLEREVPYDQLGFAISKNVTGRFGNMEKKFGNIALLIARESRRFEIISEFCSNYNSQLPGYIFGSVRPYGYCGIAELINMIREKSYSLDSVYEIAERPVSDLIIKSFFKNLKNELSNDQVTNLI